MTATPLKTLPFPQYRKYKNGAGFFKITAPDRFEEVKVLPGNRFQHFQFEATILPDRNLVQDMLNDFTTYWVVIEQDEYDVAFKQSQA
jgi:hypothetical protein